jgi:hypothetical protein
MLAKSRTNEPDDILFTFEHEDEPPSVEYLDDGSALGDPRPRIPLPSRNVDSWTESTCKPAFLLLASDEVNCSEHYHYWIIAFGWFMATHDEFMSWLHRHHFTIPTFWRGDVPNDDAQPVTAGVRRSPGRARGKTPDKTTKASEAMRTDLKDGQITKQDLEGMPEKTLLGKYGRPFEITSRDTVRKARKYVLSESDDHSNSDK